MDAFLAYGEDAVPPASARRPVRTGDTASRRERERRTLLSLARRRLQADAKALLARPEGPRLKAMLRWMRGLGIDGADEFLDVLAGEDWLLDAPEEVRRLAQRLFGRVIDRIRRRAGFHPLDDPLPWDEDGRPVASVHNQIRHILKLR